MDVRNTAKQRETPVGLMGRGVIAKSAGLMSSGAIDLTLAPVMPLTPSPTAPLPSKRAYKPRARKCKQCGEGFTPQRKSALYCSAACNQKAYRKRQSKAKKAAPKPKPQLAPFVCEHCGKSSWQPVVKDRRYCSATCRVGACGARREAAIEALALTGVGYEKAAIAVESLGMKTISASLGCLGLAYDAQARQWMNGAERMSSDEQR